jgi:hypothetical protein
MRHFVFLAAAFVASYWCPVASAMAASTCSGREAACHKFCDEKAATSEQCDPACDAMFKSCLQTGCWDSPFTGKKCGYVEK